MIKVTVIYGQPSDPDAFEDYYANKHIPLANTMPFVERLETTRFLPGPDGSQPPYYRMAELYFKSMEDLQANMASPEGQATASDLPNFSTGGFTILMGTLG